MRNQSIASCCNILIAIAFIWFTAISGDGVEFLEYRGYDALTTLLGSLKTKHPVTVVDIDDRALEAYGPWPWPRARLAEGIQKAVTNGARVIGLPLLMDTPEESFAVEAVAGLAEAFKTTFGAVDDPKLKAFYQTIEDIQVQLDPNRLLSEAITTAATVVMPVHFERSSAKSNPPAASLKTFLERARCVFGVFEGTTFPRYDGVTLPQPVFLKKVHSLGHLNLIADSDGRCRRNVPVYWFREKPVASFALALVADYLNIPEKELQLRQGNVLFLNGRRISLSENGDFLIRFNSSSNPFDRCGYTDLISGKLPLHTLGDKIVVFNLCATGMAPMFATPIDSRMPMGELTAHTLTTLLSGQPIRNAPYQPWINLLLILLVGVTITFLFPRISTFHGGIVSLAGVSILAGSSIFFFKFQDIWFPAVTPAVALTAGFALAALISLIPETRPKIRAKAAAEEIQRLQGMSLQSQGLSEAAWEKLQPLPVDEDLREILYDLAIDFEKQGKPDKALMVYEHIEETDAEFRDIQKRMVRLVSPAETVLLGEEDRHPVTSAAQTEIKTVPLSLGRYELLYPIGHGAMGTVYLGQDPHIKRETAIKTYRFAEDFDPADAIEMKRKFFREAQSAGKLSHPGIVTIFDAGEEGDLAYIAMEFLEGTDLRAHTTKGTLLPMRKVIQCVADIADALAYAHQQGVVHRDIKPANIMLLKSGAVKITDFGIARMIATSKTRTGVVKGTPYYMAPEQIIGKKVDGRCDIFSLGVVLFQLLTGSLPFTANSPGALMHKIVKDPHPDPRDLNPNILTALVTIINNALEKDVAKRYQGADQMAAHLRQIGQKIDALLLQKKQTIANTDRK